MDMFHTTLNLYVYGFEGEVPVVKKINVTISFDEKYSNPRFKN